LTLDPLICDKGERRGFNANGVGSSSPGLATQEPTLGNDEKNTQPQRGCVLCRDSRDTTPLGLMIYMAPIPKVALADSGNLGLEDKTPLGFFSRNTYGFSETAAIISHNFRRARRARLSFDAISIARA